MQASVILLDETKLILISQCLYEREQWYLFGKCVDTLSLKHAVKQSITNLYLQI